MAQGLIALKARNTLAQTAFNNPFALDDVDVAVWGKIGELLDAFARRRPVNLQFVDLRGASDAE